jgi:hypothetical protein
MEPQTPFLLPITHPEAAQSSSPELLNPGKPSPLLRAQVTHSWVPRSAGPQDPFSDTSRFLIVLIVSDYGVISAPSLQL